MSKANNGVMLAAAKRINAVRIELAECERDAREGKSGARAMMRALSRDLLTLELRFAAAIENKI